MVAVCARSPDETRFGRDEMRVWIVGGWWAMKCRVVPGSNIIHQEGGDDDSAVWGIVAGFQSRIAFVSRPCGVLADCSGCPRKMQGAAESRNGIGGRDGGNKGFVWTISDRYVGRDGNVKVARRRNAEQSLQMDLAGGGVHQICAAHTSVTLVASSTTTASW